MIGLNCAASASRIFLACARMVIKVSSHTKLFPGRTGETAPVAAKAGAGGKPSHLVSVGEVLEHADEDDVVVLQGATASQLVRGSAVRLVRRLR